MLAEVDEAKMEMDIVDEQIDTVGRAFLGLTLGCARCHDHKFDPIATADYYALAGIFKSTRTMENFKKVARWHENPLAVAEPTQARKAEHDAEVAAKKQAIEAIVAKARRQVEEPAGRGQAAREPRDALSRGDQGRAEAAARRTGRAREDRARTARGDGRRPKATSPTCAIHVRGNPPDARARSCRGRFPPSCAGRRPPPFAADAERPAGAGAAG